jgi:hypothetical protein
MAPFIDPAFLSVIAPALVAKIPVEPVTLAVDVVVSVTDVGAEAEIAVPPVDDTVPPMPTMPLLLVPLSLVSIAPPEETRLSAVPAPVVTIFDAASMLKE